MPSSLRATAASRRTRSSTSRSPRSRCALVGSSGRTGAPASPARVRASFRPLTMPMSCATASPGRRHRQLPRAPAQPKGSDRRRDRLRRPLPPRPAAVAARAERGDAAPARWRARDRDRRLHRPDLRARPTALVDPQPDLLPLGRAAPPERGHARRRVQHAGPDRRAHSGREDRLDVRALLRPGRARPPIARRPLAERPDRRHRRLAPPIVVIDPRTKRIVWQYGHLGIASRADGYLSKPDGLDLLPASAPAPARGPSRPQLTSRPLSVRRIGSLPTRGLADGHGRAPRRAHPCARRPRRRILVQPSAAWPAGARTPCRPSAGADPRRRGGALRRRDRALRRRTGSLNRHSRPRRPKTGAARAAGRLDEPLSDLGATSIGGHTYLVGGYTGSRYATAVLRLGTGTATTTVARLPVGLRYAGIAGLDGKIYVAGGLTPSGESRAVYVIDPAAGTVRLIGRLPAPVTHAPLVVLGGALYLIGGRSASGAPLARILRIDPSSGVASRAGILPGPLADESAVVVGGRAIVLGGDRRAASAAVLELTPKVDRLGAPS